MSLNADRRPVAVVIGATSKWQADGANTQLYHGHRVDDSDLPASARWGVGGAVAQKFAAEGYFVVLTTRTRANAAPLAAAIHELGGMCTIVELDLVVQQSIATAFATIRAECGDPEVVVYAHRRNKPHGAGFGGVWIARGPGGERGARLTSDHNARHRLTHGANCTHAGC